MAVHCRVYDSCYLQADCQEPGSAPDPTLGNRVWATFTFFITITWQTCRDHTSFHPMCTYDARSVAPSNEIVRAYSPADVASKLANGQQV